MSRVDLHPEKLLDRVRRGTASDEERARADAHLANCAACSIEQSLYLQTERNAAPRPGDDLALARIRGFVHRAIEERARPLGRVRKRFIATRWGIGAFAATLLLTTLVMATVLFRERQRAAGNAANPGREASAPAMPLAHAAPIVETPPPQVETAVSAPVAANAAGDARPREVAPRSTAKPERAKTTGAPTAAELFARANQLRRQDQVGEAAAAYRELQRSFPGTAEELLSRVVLGRLLLDRLGEARLALSQFDSYLAHPAPGSLREEALVGRALALARLDRTTEERLAWSALLEAYPRSTYAARARARIGTPGAP
jgi:TolA-binding protein